MISVPVVYLTLSLIKKQTFFVKVTDFIFKNMIIFHEKDSAQKDDLLFSIYFLVADDQRIMTFLRGCKFSLEKTKRKLDMYFTMRTAVPEFFNDRDVTRPELQEILKIV